MREPIVEEYEVRVQLQEALSLGLPNMIREQPILREIYRQRGPVSKWMNFVDDSCTYTCHAVLISVDYSDETDTGESMLKFKLKWDKTWNQVTTIINHHYQGLTK